MERGETSVGYNPPFRKAIVSWETCLCHLKTSFNSEKSPGPIWRLATLSICHYPYLAQTNPSRLKTLHFKKNICNIQQIIKGPMRSYNVPSSSPRTTKLSCSSIKMSSENLKKQHITCQHVEAFVSW